ncbi:hypothetical protein SLA2020_102680 [Shorea laevis]
MRHRSLRITELEPNWVLHDKCGWCLSGTLIQKTTDDLYSYFRFLKYYPLSTLQSFHTTISSPIRCDPAKGYPKLQAILKRILMHRTNGPLLDGKPIITLPPKLFREFVAAGTVKVNCFNILLMLLHLHQACNHPLLVKGSGSSALWRYSAETAKKLPSEKITSFLSHLEASVALCGICN